MVRRIRRFAFAALASVAQAVPAQDPVPLYPENYTLLLENDRVRVLDFRLKKRAREIMHSHPAAVTYMLASFRIRFTFPDGRTFVREAKAGDVLFGETVTHSPENIGDTDAHGLLVELKTPAAAPADALTAFTFIHGHSRQRGGAPERASGADRPEPNRATPTISTSPSTRKTNSCGSRCGATRRRSRPTSRRRSSRSPSSGRKQQG